MYGLQKNLIRQRGFTLLEAVVSLLVLSIGMLGIGALFFDGIKSGRTAVYRTTAVYLAADMADRIRSNPSGGPAYADAGSDNSCLNGNKQCSADEIAQEDKLNWETDITDHLPADADGTVTVGLGAGGATTIYTIDLSWPEVGFPEPLTYSLLVEL